MNYESVPYEMRIEMKLSAVCPLCDREFAVYGGVGADGQAETNSTTVWGHLRAEHNRSRWGAAKLLADPVANKIGIAIVTSPEGVEIICK